MTCTGVKWGLVGQYKWFEKLCDISRMQLRALMVEGADVGGQ